MNGKFLKPTREYIMEDISKCFGKGCALIHMCHRYELGTPNENQTYLMASPVVYEPTLGCNMFWMKETLSVNTALNLVESVLDNEDKPECESGGSGRLNFKSRDVIASFRIDDYLSYGYKLTIESELGYTENVRYETVKLDSDNTVLSKKRWKDDVSFHRNELGDV